MEQIPNPWTLSGPRWTGVLRKLAKEKLDKAVGLLGEMQQHRIECNSIHFCTLLSACDSQGEWQWAVNLLWRMHEQHLQVDVLANNNAINACSKGRSWQTSLQILEYAWQSDSMDLDVVSFGAAMAGGVPPLLHKMRHLRIQPNTICYNAGITVCEEWTLALEMFSEMLAVQLQPDLRSGNSVLKQLPNSESLAFLETMKVLNIADEISYNTAIHASPWHVAIHLFSDMMIHEIRPNVIAVSATMQLCHSASEWQNALVIFRHVEQQRMVLDTIGISTLLRVCDKGGQWQLILDLMRNSKVVDSQCLSIGMNALTRQQHWEDAVHLFEVASCKQIDLHCYTALVHACGQGKQWQSACTVLAEVQPDTAIMNAIISITPWEFGSMLLLQQMGQATCETNLGSFKAITSSLDGEALHEHWHVALWLRDEMHKRHFEDMTLENTLTRMVSFKQPVLQPLLSSPVEALLDYEKHIKSCKADGDWESALVILDQLYTARCSPRLSTFNSLIHTFEKASAWNWALAVLANMKDCMVETNRVSFNSAISACEKGRRWRWALELFHQLDDADEVSYNAAMSALEKSGHWQQTLLLLEQLMHHSILNPDEVSFNACMSACAKGDQWQVALALFETMQRLDIVADEITYNCLASACEAEQWQLSLFFLLNGAQPTLRALLKGSAVRMTPTECSQVLWRLSKLSRVGLASEVLIKAAQQVATVVDVREFNLQELISSLWSLHSLPAAFSEEAFLWRKELHHRLQTKSLAQVGLRHLATLGKVLAEGPSHEVAEDLRTVQMEMARRIESFPLHSMSESALTELATAALSLMYASHFSGHNMADTAFYRIRGALSRLGAHLDAIHPTVAVSPLSLHSSTVGPVDMGIPRVLQDYNAVMVVWKPPHWQVDERDSKVEVVERGLMSTFIQAMAPQHPVVYNEAHQRGFLHRLDVPSSGLLLIAQSYEVLMDLKFQLSTGLLERDYLVLSHGHMPERLSIQSRISWKSQGPDANEASLVDVAGRNSKTNLLTRSRLRGMQRPFSFLEISICTGRRHQIRVHLSYIGHPTVMDGKYTSLPTQQEDAQWCPRNFLHRHRLAFQQQGRQFEVFEALPADLAAALEEIDGTKNRLPRRYDSNDMKKNMGR